MSSLFQPTKLHEYLRSIGTHAKKGLSQNFLIDGNILRKIIHSADVKPGDLVIEIGPGPGALTQGLLEAGCHVVAIEKDSLFAKELNQLQTPDNRLQVFEGDALTFPIIELLKEKKQKAKVVANLPYHITTPLLAKLILMNDYIETITVMVQKEVAKRFVAKENTEDYSSFTIFLSHYCKASYLFTVQPTCFFPRPKIQSAVVQLELQKPQLEIQETFFPKIRAAFQQRRKMLRNSWRDFYPVDKIENGLQTIGFKETARPEELSLNDFFKLTTLLDKAIVS